MTKKFIGWGLTLLQRSSQCILQPQSTGQLEFELTYYDIAVKHVSQCAMWTLLLFQFENLLKTIWQDKINQASNSCAHLFSQYFSTFDDPPPEHIEVFEMRCYHKILNMLYRTHHWTVRCQAPLIHSNCSSTVLESMVLDLLHLARSLLWFL